MAHDLYVHIPISQPDKAYRVEANRDEQTHHLPSTKPNYKDQAMSSIASKHNHLEKCDLVWGPNGSRLYLNNDFERGVEREFVARQARTDYVDSDDESPFESYDCDKKKRRFRTSLRSWRTSKTIRTVSTSGSWRTSSSGSRSFAASSTSLSMEIAVSNKPPTALDRTKERLKDKGRQAGHLAAKTLGIPAVIVFDVIGAIVPF